MASSKSIKLPWASAIVCTVTLFFLVWYLSSYPKYAPFDYILTVTFQDGMSKPFNIYWRDGEVGNRVLYLHFDENPIAFSHLSHDKDATIVAGVEKISGNGAIRMLTIQESITHYSPRDGFWPIANISTDYNAGEIAVRLRLRDDMLATDDIEISRLMAVSMDSIELIGWLFGSYITRRLIIVLIVADVLVLIGTFVFIIRRKLKTEMAHNGPAAMSKPKQSQA